MFPEARALLYMALRMDRKSRARTTAAGPLIENCHTLAKSDGIGDNGRQCIADKLVLYCGRHRFHALQ